MKKDDAYSKISWYYKWQYFIPDQGDIINAVQKTAIYKMPSDKKAFVKIVTTRRVFSSTMMNILFGIGGENHELVKQETILNVPYWYLDCFDS